MKRERKLLFTRTEVNIMGSKSNFSPAQVKEMLDAHENTLMKFFNTVIERLERKVDSLSTENEVLKKEMVDLKSSMQFHYDPINEKFLELDMNVSQVYVVNDENIKTLIDDHRNLHVEVRDLEHRSRSNNLRFEAKIKKLIKEKLGIENFDIEHTHRIGKEERDDPSQKRTIIAKFLNYKDKEKVLQKYRSGKLLEEKLYINKEFSEETMKIGKELFKQAKELRKKGNLRR